MINTLRKTVSTFIFILGSAIFLSSCGDDDDNDTTITPNNNQSENPSQNTNKEGGEWFVYEGNDIGWSSNDNSVYVANVKENPIAYYDNINADGDVDSKKMYSTKSALRLVNGNTIEYWTFNVGIWGCKESLNSDYYWYTDTDYRSYFEDEFKAEKIICYSSWNYKHTYTEKDGKIYVENGITYIRNKKGLIKEGDSDGYVKTDVKISSFDNEKKIANRCKSEVRCTSSYESDYEHSYTIKITTPLSKTFDYNNVVVYGIEYGIGLTSEYVEESISPINGTVYFYPSIVLDNYIQEVSNLKEQIAYLDAWLRLRGVYGDIDDAIASGKLSESTLELIEEWREYKESLNKLLNKLKQNFEAKVYVRYGGTKYYIGNI